MTVDDRRLAVVTGGSSGIGRGIALRLAEIGLAVAVADKRRQPKTGQHYETDVTTPTDEAIEAKEGGRSLFVETDIANETDIEAAVETIIDEFGRLDVLVNNAGILIPGTTQTLSKDEWQQQVDVNLTGQFLAAKHTLPHIVNSDAGRIVNISSINAHFGGAGPAYASTKAGIVNLTRDLATELAVDGVTVNAILPGVIKTPMQDLNDRETMERQAENTPLPRLGEPEDVAAAVEFFVSRDAEWITGAQLRVDGGYLAGGY